MALIRKAHGTGHAGCRMPPREQPLRFRETKLDDETMCRDAERGPETAHEMIRTHSGGRGEIVHSQARI